MLGPPTMVNVQGLQCATLTLIAALLAAIGLLIYGGSRDDCPGYMLVAGMAPIIVGITWILIVAITGFRTGDGTPGHRLFNVLAVTSVIVVTIGLYVAGGVLHDECVGKCLLVAASVIVGTTVIVVIVMFVIACAVLNHDGPK